MKSIREQAAEIVAKTDGLGLLKIGTTGHNLAVSCAEAALAETQEAIRLALLTERESIAKWLETQRNDIPATGEEFAAALRKVAYF